MLNKSSASLGRRPNQKGRRTATVATGFVPRNEFLHSLYNRGFGLIAFLVMLPVMVFIALILLVTQGREIFYAGPRLGKDMKPFNIYKFRTLDTAKAKEITADRVLSAGTNIETKLGKYLRASRLDELPQIFNILRGDMNIVGPRPVREPLAKVELERNEHYSIRFCVKPGLVGHTQAYMCHGTAKSIRAKYNYALCCNHVNYFAEAVLIFNVGMAVVRRSLTLTWQKLMPTRPHQAAAALAEDWDLHIQQGNRMQKVTGFAGNSLGLTDPSMSGPAELLISTQNGGLRRAQIELTQNSSADADFLSHSFECTTGLSAHVVSRFLHDTAVVGPKRPASASDRDMARFALPHMAQSQQTPAE